MVTKLQTADVNMTTRHYLVYNKEKYNMIFQKPSRKCVYFYRILTDILKKENIFKSVYILTQIFILL